MMETSASARGATSTTAAPSASNDQGFAAVICRLRQLCRLSWLLAIDVHEVGGAVLVVVDAVVTDLVVAVVDHAIAVVVDAVVANFLRRAFTARVLVGGAVAVVVERVSADLDAAALGVVRGVRPERAVV